ncbi:MAG: hypothetical protein DCF32_09550 [Leptolyngbya sp.]|nr:MAG: hypothetical protein DCF32_09550 [Leptolyngbya sp.]
MYAASSSQFFASIGTPKLPSWYGPVEIACYEAGKSWAAGHTKLPVHVQVGDRDVQISRSSHVFAKAFRAGFFSFN